MAVKRIICLPVDGSKNTLKSIDYVSNHIIHELDHIYLINIRKDCKSEFVSYPDDNPPFFYPTDIPFDEINDLEEKDSNRLLERLSEPIKQKTSHVTLISVMSTDPRKALEKEINKIKPDLVVMGNRGLGMVSRIMMGSVSNYILNHIEYPVMIIPDQ